MKRFLAVATVGLLLVSAQAAQAQNRQSRADRAYPPQLDGATVETYKTVGDVKLNVYIFNPENHKPTDRRPAIVFFFGGGWTSGTPKQFEQQCKHLASRGMVAMTADYRVASRHQTKAIDCVRDGKSAVRWLRANAERLGVDPNKIVAGGGSAGGHVAACTGLVADLNEAEEAKGISSRPNAMVLFNPALILAPYDGMKPFDNERLASLRQRVGDDPRVISPIHHIAADAPPTLILHGKGDTTVPYKTAELFCEAMHSAGNRCDLVGYEDQPHGFFNYGRGDNSNYEKTVAAMDQFLESLGYLKP
ncbi:MAG: alpha/beta hydrolase [Planctomycetales bacterium]|nr:alpha/beta hydrolase [Planctomycetales bacterium]